MSIRRTLAIAAVAGLLCLPAPALASDAEYVVFERGITTIVRVDQSTEAVQSTVYGWESRACEGGTRQYREVTQVYETTTVTTTTTTIRKRGAPHSNGPVLSETVETSQQTSEPVLVATYYGEWGPCQ